MGEVIAVLLLVIAGVVSISTGVYLTLGAGPALIALGIACLIAALITVRGLSHA